jgi:hypothetical protein
MPRKWRQRFPPKCWYPPSVRRHNLEDRDPKSNYPTNFKANSVPNSIEISSVKVKVKVKLSLCLTKHHDMKTCWGSGGIAPGIPNLGTRWWCGVRFTPPPRRFTSRERASVTRWIGDWVQYKSKINFQN